ncbi:hypothetical protein ACL02S_24350, partial [Nocardia sp. 004]|uniref:hypothetical protein n=1 Tax=Nocardia sp. 004 TaxID=3385978 RepID=UPI0039A152BB
LPGLRVEAVDFEVETAKFDLSLTVRELAVDPAAEPAVGSAVESGVAGMYAEFSYARDLFDEDTVRGFAERFT